MEAGRPDPAKPGRFGISERGLGAREVVGPTKVLHDDARARGSRSAPRHATRWCVM